MVSALVLFQLCQHSLWAAKDKGINPVCQVSGGFTKLVTTELSLTEDKLHTVSGVCGGSGRDGREDFPGDGYVES